jgi:hypothetical protein
MIDALLTWSQVVTRHDSPLMKMVIVLLSFFIVANGAAAKEFKLYATLLEDTPVELADGAKWMMEKGDVFPVLMYKEMQTKIVLQLAGTSFWTETKRVRILRDDEVKDGLVNYRRNVQAYLDTKAKRLKSGLDPTRSEAPAVPGS